MPSQRPFFLSTVFAAFRQQTAAPSLATTTSQPSKQTTSSSYSTAATAATSAAAAAAAARSAQQQSTAPSSSQQTSSSSSSSSSAAAAAAGGPAAAQAGGGTPQASPAHSPVPIPCPGRRRGSDSSTEGFRNVRGADKWYIGGRTATGEERFFKLGVMRRVRSNDRLSLDKLSL